MANIGVEFINILIEWFCLFKKLKIWKNQIKKYTQ